MTWLSPRGEILFFKKPSQTLAVQVKTSKSMYAPGDTVNYEINVFDKAT
jgi:hypothetical protein